MKLRLQSKENFQHANKVKKRKIYPLNYTEEHK
jgi:hypothetical protein